MLLLHWSMLNYAAVVKILKKHGASPLQKHLHRSATKFHLQHQAHMPLLSALYICVYRPVTRVFSKG